MPTLECLKNIKITINFTELSLLPIGRKMEEQESKRLMKFPELEETKFIITALKAFPETDSVLTLLMYIKPHKNS